MTTATAPEPAVMTAKERQELIRIVKARFRLLRMQAKTRSHEIVEAERKAYEHEKRAALTKLRNRVATLNKKAQPLIDELNAIFDAAEAEGISWSGSRLIEGFTNVRFTPKSQFSYHQRETLEQTIIAEVDRAELAVLEELIVGGLETEAARSFLEQIPTIQGLVEGKQLLTAIGKG